MFAEQLSKLLQIFCNILLKVTFSPQSLIKDLSKHIITQHVNNGSNVDRKKAKKNYESITFTKMFHRTAQQQIESMYKRGKKHNRIEEADAVTRVK